MQRSRAWTRNTFSALNPWVARTLLTELLLDGNTVANYQPGVGITGTLTATAWANQIGAAPALAEVGGSGPIIVSNDWVPKLYLPAAASNTVTAANATVTGNQTITLNIAIDDYTPAADVTLVDKTSGNDGFAIKYLTTDKIRLVIGDGVSLTNVDVATASSFTNGSQHTITIAWEDGVGATFSYDGVQSGSQVAAAKTLTNAAVALTIGSATSACRLYRLAIGSVYDMNPADSAETTTNAATFVSNGKTYTLNNTGALPAQIARSPQYLFNGTSHYLTMTTTLNQPHCVFFVGKQITWFADDRFWDGAVGVALAAQYASGASPQVNIYAGASVGPATEFALNAKNILIAGFSGASSYVQIANNAAVTGNASTNNPSGMNLGTNQAASGNFGNIQANEVIILNALPSAAKLSQIISLLGAIHGISV